MGFHVTITAPCNTATGTSSSCVCVHPGVPAVTLRLYQHVVIIDWASTEVYLRKSRCTQPTTTCDPIYWA